MLMDVRGTASARALRTSSYTIYVELPEDPTKVLLVHGYTGAYDIVSRKVAAFVRACEVAAPPKPLYGEWQPEEIRLDTVEAPGDDVLEELRRRGYLTTKSVDEEESFFVKNVNAMHAGKLMSMPSYIVMPTYSCNLRCDYCFQDNMRTDPSLAHLLRVMTPKMADRILDALPQIEQRHGVAAESTLPRHFTFFGGEPLLAGSRRSVEYFMRGAIERGAARFGAITNGTELEAYGDLLSPDLLGYLQITLDGPLEDHDRRRVYADGSGSFDRIVRNIDMALSREVMISVRLNIDRENFGRLPELADFFERRGWHENKRFSAYAAVVHSYETAAEQRERSRLFNSWELGQALLEARKTNPSMKIISFGDDGLKSRVLSIFTKKKAEVPSMTSFCGAHNRMYIFDAFGDIYACWERTGDPGIRIGTISEESTVVMNDERNGQWRSRTVVSNATCRKCRFALYCGGGCAVLAEGNSGTMFSNYCDAFGKRFRSRVAEAYVEYTSGAEIDEARLAAAEIQESLR